MKIAISLAEKRIFNDALIRTGIRRLLKNRLETLPQEAMTSADWITSLKDQPLAEKTEAANEQHYEIPSDYFKKVLGPNLKYSCGYWLEDCNSLEASEVRMLEMTCQRAELKNGQKVLELGCGWGSLSLWMAQKYPESTITAVSNSHSQRKYIEEQARVRRICNLKVITCDINHFQPDAAYDRIVSVEMFEHVRNHQALFRRIEGWLEQSGKLFVHVFAHKESTYLFEANKASDWMSRYFFSGGIMPAADLLPTAAKGILKTEGIWKINGTHYSKTLEAWLQKQDTAEPVILEILRLCYGESAPLWLQRWRMFYMASSELFAYRNGEEWIVMHYLFSKSS